MGRFLIPSDVLSIVEVDAEILIDDAEAQAWLVAPCLFDDDPDKPLDPMKEKAAKAILRGVVLRWNDAGSGVETQTTAGPFSQTITPQVRRNSFWPSEIKDLQKLCKGAGSGKAFSVDTAPAFGSIHADICSLHFGATYCSCGADIAGFPLWE